MTDTNALIGTELKTWPGSAFGHAYFEITCNDAADSMVTMFQAEEACDLTGIMAYCRWTWGTPPNYKFQLQGITTGGDPDGVNLAETAAFQPAATTNESHNFTSPYTCTKGQALCARLVYADDGSTIGSSNHATFIYATDSVRYMVMPYSQYWTGSAWTGDEYKYPSFAVHTDITGVDLGGIYNIGKTSTRQSILTGGDRYAQRIQIPAGEDIELHVDGFSFAGRVENTPGADVIIGVWPETGAALVTTTIDTGQQENQMDTDPVRRDYIFSSSVTMTAGEIYYVGFEHTGAGSGDDLYISYLEPTGLDGLKSWPGGDAFYASHYTSAAWADNNARRLLLNLILSSIHGSGGGGSTTRPTMGVIG